MKYIDMHCDTLMTAYRLKKKNMYEMPGMLDVKRMKQAGQMAQFFAIFMPPPDEEKRLNRDSMIDDEEYYNYCLDVLQTTIKENNKIIAQAYNANDINENERNGRISAFLTFEDGRMINGKMENIDKFYDDGIRLITLTWNYANCFGAPNSSDMDIMNQGLTEFGKESIEYMNTKGILIDVSHLSDGGFKDVARLSKKPFIASHSNCRELSPHQRNLTDPMIRQLANSGGVIGLNFGPQFLNSDITVKTSTKELICEHILRLIDKGGIECVMLGSDLDGVDGELEINSPEKMELIFDCLAKNGISQNDIEKIAWRNAYRVINEVL
ncbi:MAG: dipeptidase [Suipraeoptans sp.]